MTATRFMLTTLTTIKALLYLVIAATLVVSPLCIDFSQIKSMPAWYGLYSTSSALAGICLTNGLAHLNVVRQPAWAWDEIFLPLSGMLALSLLMPL